eukprot:GHVN01058078.1.p1 GENE.GHVN01058078.1~~GHVN01058078.1.p1  ORF type:complete len:187 (-),score=39.64 GHVN01058078.1:815-1375(-)
MGDPPKANRKEPQIDVEDEEVEMLDDRSDLSMPEEGLSFKDRPRLLRWKFKEGGDRLPRFENYIPHCRDANEVKTSQMRSEAMTLAICRELAADAKQAQLEYIYTKQQADILQNEKDLLKWHCANNSKGLHVKRGEWQTARELMRGYEEKMEIATEDNQRLQREHALLAREINKLEQEIREMKKGI